ncbi:hypothetical protein C8R46DRAFT_1057645 [Mycena filopes]|nr:hypothetical protein C8R46DRAFT_1057645 [Mycena filopes]
MAARFVQDTRAGPAMIIWNQWEPACDACGRLESTLKKKQLLSCSACLLAKYCSKECQSKDWSAGHKSNRCHLFEADRKLSTVFAKSLGPGNFLNTCNHSMIAAAALKNNLELAKLVHVGIFIKLVGDRMASKYDHRTFIIDAVGFLPRDSINEFAQETTWRNGMNTKEDMIKTEHTKILVGFCKLPDGTTSGTQLWMLPHNALLTQAVLPPGFDLHRYITHVNRGITHFHASHWPLPRNISDADLEAAVMPKGWAEYAMTHHLALSGLKGQGVIGVEHPDGTRTPIYKWSTNGHFRRCAPGETDTDGPEELRKQVVDPSRMVRKLSALLDDLSSTQGRFTKKYTGLTAEQLKAGVHPSHD